MRHVIGVFHNLGDLAIEIEDGIVGRLDMHFAVEFPHALEAAADELAFAQLEPEFPIGFTANVVRRTEHAVMLPLDFTQGVTHGREKIAIGSQHPTFKIKLDDGLGFVQCTELGVGFCAAHFFFGHINGEFDDFDRFPIWPLNGVVRSPYPDLLAAFAIPLEFSGMEFTLSEMLPEAPVIPTVRFTTFDEHTVMPPLDLIQRVPHQAEEILVGIQNLSRRRELDDRLGSPERCKLVFQFTAPAFVGRDIRGELDDFDGLAGFAQDGRVDGVQPDRLTMGINTSKLSAHVFACTKVGPEVPVFVA